MRSHPAINFYRSGLPIVIAGDDPGSFGYNELTVDYYMAFMAWGLNLADLKIIANNSLIYSTVPDEVNKKQRPNESFIPFGAGPRSCVAQRFALLEMKLLLASILFKFKFEKCSKTIVIYFVRNLKNFKY